MSGDDQLRERLAEALYLDPAVSFTAEERKAAANVLAPVVREYAQQWAAEELRKAAHFLDDGDTQAIEVALGGAAYVHRVLCDRAAALDAAREQQP